MRHLTKAILGLSLIVVLGIAACFAPGSQNTPTPAPPTATATGPQETTYDDPFAYCSAVGTVDVPNEQYNGPKLPESVIQTLIKQGVLLADAPAEFQKNAIWRCMNGKVWACHFGANIPCQEKADTSQEPTTEMKDFCKENPNSEGIPAVVAGRTTVYVWKCTDGKPEVDRQGLEVDPQGYPANYWYELTP